MRLPIPAAAAAILIAATAAADAGVFLDTGRRSPVAAAEPTVIRRRIATLDAPALRDAALHRAPATLDLFPDASFALGAGRIERLAGDDFNWTGDLFDADGDRAVLSMVWRNGRCAGLVTDHAGRVFQFHHTDDGDMRIEQLDPTAAPACAFDAKRHAPATDRAPNPGDAAGATRDEIPVADVLLLYTPAARQVSGGHKAVRLAIDLAVFDANVALEDSGANLRLRAAHVQETDYVETGSFGTDLSRLTASGDGFMDEAHPLRDAYGADFVALINVVGDACGVAYLMGSPTATFHPWAFSVNARQCFFIQVLAHELGHNMGCHHDRDNAGGQGAFPYSYGYRTPAGTGTQFKTVMAYDPGTTVRLFSNPSATWNDKPMGVDIGAPDSAFNALSITNSASAIVSWRPTTEVIAGDLNFDGVVDGADFGAFLGSWGDGGSGADFNNDGSVDGADLGLLLANWGG